MAKIRTIIGISLAVLLALEPVVHGQGVQYRGPSGVVPEPHRAIETYFTPRQIARLKAELGKRKWGAVHYIHTNSTGRQFRFTAERVGDEVYFKREQLHKVTGRPSYTHTARVKDWDGKKGGKWERVTRQVAPEEPKVTTSEIAAAFEKTTGKTAVAKDLLDRGYNHVSNAADQANRISTPYRTTADTMALEITEDPTNKYLIRSSVRARAWEIYHNESKASALQFLDTRIDKLEKMENLNPDQTQILDRLRSTKRRFTSVGDLGHASQLRDRSDFELATDKGQVDWNTTFELSDRWDRVRNTSAGFPSVRDLKRDTDMVKDYDNTFLGLGSAHPRAHPAMYTGALLRAQKVVEQDLKFGRQGMEIVDAMIEGNEIPNIPPGSSNFRVSEFRRAEGDTLKRLQAGSTVATSNGLPWVVDPKTNAVYAMRIGRTSEGSRPVTEYYEIASPDGSPLVQGQITGIQSTAKVGSELDKQLDQIALRNGTGGMPPTSAGAARQDFEKRFTAAEVAKAEATVKDFRTAMEEGKDVTVSPEQLTQSLDVLGYQAAKHSRTAVGTGDIDTALNDKNVRTLIGSQKAVDDYYQTQIGIAEAQGDGERVRELRLARANASELTRSVNPLSDSNFREQESRRRSNEVRALELQAKLKPSDPELKRKLAEAKARQESFNRVAQNPAQETEEKPAVADSSITSGKELDQLRAKDPKIQFNEQQQAEYDRFIAEDARDIPAGDQDAYGAWMAKKNATAAAKAASDEALRAEAIRELGKNDKFQDALKEFDQAENNSGDHRAAYLAEQKKAEARVDKLKDRGKTAKWDQRRDAGKPERSSGAESQRVARNLETAAQRAAESRQLASEYQELGNELGFSTDREGRRLEGLRSGITSVKDETKRLEQQNNGGNGYVGLNQEILALRKQKEKATDPKEIERLRNEWFEKVHRKRLNEQQIEAMREVTRQKEVEFTQSQERYRALADKYTEVTGRVRGEDGKERPLLAPPRVQPRSEMLAGLSSERQEELAEASKKEVREAFSEHERLIERGQRLREASLKDEVEKSEALKKELEEKKLELANARAQQLVASGQIGDPKDAMRQAEQSQEVADKLKEFETQRKAELLAAKKENTRTRSLLEGIFRPDKEQVEEVEKNLVDIGKINQERRDDFAKKATDSFYKERLREDTARTDKIKAEMRRHTTGNGGRSEYNARQIADIKSRLEAQGIEISSEELRIAQLGSYAEEPRAPASPSRDERENGSPTARAPQNALEDDGPQGPNPADATSPPAAGTPPATATVQPQPKKRVLTGAQEDELYDSIRARLKRDNPSMSKEDLNKRTEALVEELGPQYAARVKADEKKAIGSKKEPGALSKLFGEGVQWAKDTANRGVDAIGDYFSGSEKLKENAEKREAKRQETRQAGMSDRLRDDWLKFGFDSKEADMALKAKQREYDQSVPEWREAGAEEFDRIQAAKRRAAEAAGAEYNSPTAREREEAIGNWVDRESNNFFRDNSFSGYLADNGGDINLQLTEDGKAFAYDENGQLKADGQVSEELLNAAKAEFSNKIGEAYRDERVHESNEKYGAAEGAQWDDELQNEDFRKEAQMYAKEDGESFAEADNARSQVDKDQGDSKGTDSLCPVSSQIVDDGGDCATTKENVETSRRRVQQFEQFGQTAVGIQGQIGQYRAINANSQAESYKQAELSAQLTGGIAGVGAIYNLGEWWAFDGAAGTHDENAKNLAEAKKSASNSLAFVDRYGAYEGGRAEGFGGKNNEYDGKGRRVNTSTHRGEGGWKSDGNLQVDRAMYDDPGDEPEQGEKDKNADGTKMSREQFKESDRYKKWQAKKDAFDATADSDTATGYIQTIMDEFSVNDRYRITEKINIQQEVASCKAKSNQAETRTCYIQLERRIRTRGSQLGHKRKKVIQTVENKAGAGATEQNDAKALASSAASESLFNALIKGVRATFSFMNAEELRKAANKLKKIENTPPPDLGSDGNGEIGGEAPVVQEIGLATNNPSTPNPEEFTEDEIPPLGDPIDFDDEGDTVGAGPTPGSFDGDLAAQNNAGGDLPGLSGTATEAAKADGSEEQSKAQYAGLGGSGLDYLSGGGGVFRGGRGGRGPANRNGPNLTDLLEKFLPNMKKDAEKKKRGILSFGRRNLASAARSSLLGPEANIFETVARTYRAKTRAGYFEAKPRQVKKK